MDQNNHTILLVDDEPDILDIIKYNLEKEDFNVVTANNGKEGIEAAKKHHPQLILLDVMMPEMDGIETCTLIREDSSISDTVIAFLTARSEDYSQIAGFEAGADDYIPKPIKPRVLVSRVKALLRRKGITDGPAETIALGELEINKEKYSVNKGGEELTLPKKEFELLALLCSKPGRVFTREVILNNVWGNEVVVGDRTIDVHIRKLREKIGEDYIKTVKGVGYKIEA
ncbi:response regulator transcription factor [Luteibaculum oceani]|uniref:Phosphate regulon transcriptional regulatory protein PhoB n=1 Tax=Luteibaculum oceani TaxID=1294296 RepID=A0A5C6V275_9FLAO|nr:response regulator transcription factor [Luteibaculum oceani]TXC78920.1 response regulator transcription factor [Luteibaculum oceani]